MDTARLVAVPPAPKAAAIGVRRLAVAHIGVAVAAFGVASAMAMMQALSRANLELPFRSASMYDMSVTGHGTLMALVFTTFFIMAFGYVVAERALGRAVPYQRLAWASFWLAVPARWHRRCDRGVQGNSALYVLPTTPGTSSLLHRLDDGRGRLMGMVVSHVAVVAGVAKAQRRTAHPSRRVRRRGDRYRLVAGNGRGRRRDVAPADSMVAGTDEDRRSRAGADAVLVVRPSAWCTSGCCRHTSSGTRCCRARREEACSAIRSAGSSSPCSSCCRRRSDSTISSWIQGSRPSGRCCTRSTRSGSCIQAS